LVSVCDSDCICCMWIVAIEFGLVYTVDLWN
jgi:hypothetical protein